MKAGAVLEDAAAEHHQQAHLGLDKPEDLFFKLFPPVSVPATVRMCPQWGGGRAKRDSQIFLGQTDHC